MRWFETHAPALLEQGYEPLPIRRGQKAPAVSRWSQVTIDAARVEQWARDYPACGIGLRTGTLVGLDIDILDPDLAHQAQTLAFERLGTTLIRVGQWPKRLLLYRTEQPFPKIDVKPLEVLGAGQQFVAFGQHPGTGRPYGWPLGETPLDVPLDELPGVDQDGMTAFVAEARAFIPEMSRPGARSGSGRKTGRSGGARASGIVRDGAGKVVDGRDDWLSRIAYHAVHDALDRDDDLGPDRIAETVWERFLASTDLSRPRQDGGRAWSFGDALKKVCEKLRLQARGVLPPRQSASIEADYVAPSLSADQARATLETEIAAFCRTVLDHHSAESPVEPVPIGLRATTGLGKSTIARRQFMELRGKLEALGLPHRFLVFAPSHALAEETAEAWRELGLRAAVLRGHERMHPVLKAPMCRDTEAMRAALNAGADPQTTVCAGQGGLTCSHFHDWLKQSNRDEVRAADVVVAPYDALYTGFAVDASTIAAIIVDEGCWARAVRTTTSLNVEALTIDLLPRLGVGMEKRRAAIRRADHLALRQKLQRALGLSGTGPVRHDCLVEAGLSSRDCIEAIRMELSMMSDPGLIPCLTGAARGAAFAAAARNERLRSLARAWQLAANLLDSGGEASAQLRVELDGESHSIKMIGAVAIDDDLVDKPVLHLDATLRDDIATRLLPGLKTRIIEAAAPHMSLHLVTGRFGKSAIVPDDRAAPDENARRGRNLSDCVDQVRWHTRRLAPGTILVVTYKAIEDAFSDIPGVVTGHFNALAGLDGFRDVRGIFIIGRPLPRDSQLPAPCAALFDLVADGEYRWQTSAVRMRDGSSRAVRVLRHDDEVAEIVRAAICDDELIQDIGRGRGVNRTEADPLEVHVLADVALPLVHDSVVNWDSVKPDIVQRMLLAGVAVDSPADAVALHPHLFDNEKQAQKAFERAGFKRQIPYNIYRGMSLKSAAYRRSGRGRSWQTALWLDRDVGVARAEIEVALGPLSGWKSE
ncbi:bifunctional DNA primase/polymerase [Pelagovum pacificum]|nr:bifunctional DNA primase/polymerase [Pelagovum pacificum]